MPSSAPARLSIFRLIAASAFALIALSACNPAGSETTIEAPVADPTSAPAATSAPLLVDVPESAAVTSPSEVPVVAPGTESAATTPSTTVDTATEEPSETDVDPGELPEGYFVDVPNPVDEPAEGDTTETDAAEPDGTVEATETASFEVTGANCLDGRWIAAPGELQLYFDTIGLANGIDMNGSGHLIIVLENGNYVYDARIVNEINIDGFPTTSVVDGVTQGNYTYENGFIVANETAGSLEAYVDLGGTRIDATELGQDFAQMGAFHEAPFDCNGDNPSIYFDVAPGVARYEMRFIPWDGTRP